MSDDYAIIIQWTPFPGRWEPISTWQLQDAEWELKLCKRYYHEHAIKTAEGFLYPREIAEKIVDYWSKKRDWAKYRIEARNA